ncbi:MAG: hypothetical protein GTO24_15510, partial [candidate division Zixibacteria bacterium]|nr:hypothetical protein [candidate division Zixibacteria bacterium]
MKKTVLVLVIASVTALSLSATETVAHMGAGPWMDSGMMGRGWGMGPGMMHR